MAKSRVLKPNESRRSFIRVPFEDGQKVTVGFPTITRSYEALDVSVYGVSFQVEPDQVPRFKPMMELSDVSFVVGAKKIHVQASVTYLQPMPTQGRYKVALHFTHVEQADVWDISAHIAEKSGKKSSIQIKVPKKKAKPKAKTKKPSPAKKRAR